MRIHTAINVLLSREVRQCPPVSSCVCLHGDDQWTCEHWVIDCGPDSWITKWEEITHILPSSLLSAGSFLHHVVVVWCWWCRIEACAHICFSTPCWPRLRPLWARSLIIHVVGGEGTEILFSAYLGIYCSTECNITIQKQDPNHTNPTIPLSFSSLSLRLPLSTL